MFSTIYACRFLEFDTSCKRTHDVVRITRETTDKEFMDLNGRFPCKFLCGNEHVLIAYYFDGTEFLVDLCKIDRLQQSLNPGNLHKTS